MRSFSERNLRVVGIVGILTLTGAVVLALQFHNISFLTREHRYSAYFADASGLRSGAAVQVSGFRVGEVSSVGLDESGVVVTFSVNGDVALGERTEAAIKTKSLLGAKVLEVIPRGDGELVQPIPQSRTTPAYQLPDALGELADTIDGLDTGQLDRSLQTLADTFADTPPDLQLAMEGVTRFSRALTERDEDLRALLASANDATTVLADHSGQIVDLVHRTNSLLSELKAQSVALDQLSGNVAAVSRELSALIDENRTTLRPALEKVNGVLTILDNRKSELQKSIHLLDAYAMSLGESLSSGPFYKAYVANLLPGQFIQPFIDAAFSDLGLDPAVQLPSELGDPQVGQPGTPALPSPYPRTGQGGEPRLTVPDAITGNPEDAVCGPPGIPLPGPGCYPYREPPPAPPPGGPPPGPPATMSAPAPEQTP